MNGTKLLQKRQIDPKIAHFNPVCAIFEKKSDFYSILFNINLHFKPIYVKYANKKGGPQNVSRLVFSRKDILLDTQLLTDTLWNSILVNNDIHSLVARKSL